MSPLMMTFVLGACVVAMWWLSRFARKRLGLGAGTIAPSSMKVVGKRVLEPRKSLYVVELGDRYIMVGTAENSISLIDHISADEFAKMLEPEVAPTPLLPLAKLAKAKAGAGDTPAADADAAAGEQRFATVGESFNLLLNKARNSRSARASVQAQVDDAASDSRVEESA